MAIIATTVIVFGNPVSKQSMIGSTIAILGALLYSLAKANDKPKPKAA